MGTIFRKTFTKPLPPNSEITTRSVKGEAERIARWKDGKGKTRTAKLNDDGTRILVQTSTYTAKYRDGSGNVREVPTKCKDKTAAQQVLLNLEKRADGVRSGMRTAAEDAVVDHRRTPLAEHFTAYNVYLQVEGTTEEHRENVRRCFDKVADECGFCCLADFRRESLEAWLTDREREGMGARTRNIHRACMVAFANWCVETDRLVANPFAKVAKADEESGKRRKRRSMTEAELVKLLDSASRRPLLEAMTVRRGKRKGQAVAKVKDESKRQLELLGRERALIYKTMVLTGLRKGELASLTVGQLDLDSAAPFVLLNPEDEKNGEGNAIPLRADLVADLRDWLAFKLSIARSAAHEQGAPVPARLSLDTPLFTVPAGLIRILDRDLKLAGIPKKDERGRTLDVHALRHSFSTLLSKGGVAPRTAQAAMRHSDINLTMTTYTDPKLLDVHAALDVLPALPLPALASSRTDDTLASAGASAVCALAPMLAPDSDSTCPVLAKSVNSAIQTASEHLTEASDVSACGDNEKQPLTTIVSGCQKERATRLELATSSLGSRR